MQKGQGALEYIMTYGWALLIIVALGGALFATGILNPTSYATKNCHFRYFTYMDEKLSGTNFTMDLVNGPHDISITGMTVDGISAQSVDTNPLSPSGGTRFIVQGKIPGLAASGAFSFPVKIAYDVQGGISGNIDEGTCTGST